MNSKSISVKRTFALRMLLVVLALCLGVSLKSSAQVFWTETFGTGCNQGQTGNNFSSANGTWTTTFTGVNDPFANQWYVSATENGFPAGSCRGSCSTNPALSNQTLHVGNVNGSPNAVTLCAVGDCGAVYDPGGAVPNQVRTNKRIDSPFINCTGSSNIQIRFDYIEYGESSNDNATLWYFNGTAWSLLTDPPKTDSLSCSGQGIWTAFTFQLPVSANNNPNVKIGFNWTNNDDASGNNSPSFAVDNITLTSTPVVANFTTGSTSICENNCISFLDLSTGSPTGWQWTFQGANPSTSFAQNPTNICYPTSGTYFVQLIVSNQGSTDTLIRNSYITVNYCPPPAAAFSSNSTGGCDTVCIDFYDQSTNNPTQWHWYFPGATPSFSLSQNPTNICYTSDGLFDVTLVVTNGGGSDSLIKYSFINMSSLPYATISNDTSMAWGGSDSLLATGGIIYHWFPSTGLDTTEVPNPVATPLVTTTYYCYISDGTCSTIRQVTIEITHTDKVYIPDAFAPESNGPNALFKILGNNIYSARLTIFDRWGEKVFETSNKDDGWDGTYNGDKMSVGVYTYIATVIFDNPKSPPQTKTGTIALIR